jgi:hypothetical protein
MTPTPPAPPTHGRKEAMASTREALIDAGLRLAEGTRLIVAATAYLDGCLRDRGVRALLLEARAEPAVTEEISRRNIANAQLCRPDFAALGHPHPYESARAICSRRAMPVGTPTGRPSSARWCRTWKTTATRRW